MDKNREKAILHHCFASAKKYYKNNEPNKARDYCDMGIAYVAGKREKGLGAKDLIENVRVELWLERFWMFLENKKLML
tara:strand:+ start:361 stop:594 length:234 start_codon:yes stop_codon:yes gene_type:complete